MIESLPFAFCVVVLAATGAAAVRLILPNASSFAEDRERLEVLAWTFSTSAVLLLTLITTVGPS